MFFGRLSIWTGVRALQLLRKAAGTLGGDCWLCGAASPHALACAPCAQALPRATAACPRCALPMPTPDLCGPCLRRPPPFESSIAAFDYRFPVDRLVQRFKFSGDLAAGRWLALQLAQRAVHAPRPQLLVAPPLTRARLTSRGFNQALEIARVVGSELGVPTVPRALARVRETAPQPGLGGRARRENLRDAFRCSLALEGRDVAIVDDVMTTGATAAAVARALRSAGAGRVSVWVVARTPEPRR